MLALRDLSEKLPALNLKRPWTCLSWTKLGLEVKAALECETILAQEALLGRHLLGFINENLWRIEEMPQATAKLDFNDIALIRAFSKIGRDCERKIKDLIASVVPIVNATDIGVGEVTCYQQLYKSSSCSCLQRFLVHGHTKDSDPRFQVSIGCEEPYGDFVAIWILMSPKHPKFEAAMKAVASPLKRLHARNPLWKAGSGEAGDFGVLEIAIPLTDLLAAEDQQRKLAEFVHSALTDLKEAGAVTAIVSAVTGSPLSRPMK